MKFRDFLKLHPMFPVVMFFSIAVAGTSYYLGKLNIAVVELALGVVLSVIVFFAERKNFSDLKKTVAILNSSVVTDEVDRISSIPLPFVICTEDGGISWYNNMFAEEIIGDTELSVKQIRNFVPHEKLVEGEKKSFFNATYNSKRYTVHVTKVNDDLSNEYVLYFIDDTYYKNIIDEYNASKPAVIVVSVDAMDDVSSRISQNEFSALLGDVERLITTWFSGYKCIIRKISDGRFFVIAEYRVLEMMKNDKFNLLDRVRDYRLGSIQAQFTLSVGIGTGSDLASCEKGSRKSLDMAKGRGGDQVVICDKDNYEFFGGVASGVESRNQVQSRIVASSVEELIKHSSSVLIMGHKNSDLDALGSAIGVSEAVKHLGKRVKIVIDEKGSMAKPLLKNYKEKVDADIFLSADKVLGELQNDTLLIITDVMRPGFTDVPLLVEKAKNVVVIDHHRMSVDYISNSLIFYHEPNTSSTGEMVTELIRFMPSKPKISEAAAEGLLSGIYLDTKNFTLKTGVRTFEAAAYLKECGADTITVRKLFAATAEENALISKIVNSAEIKGKFAFAVANKNDSSVRLAAAKAADDLLNIENVDASFVIFPVSETDSAISARSYGRVNVQLIMEKLGGGGHLTMAAAQLNDTTVDKALVLLSNAVGSIAKNPKK